MQERSQQVLSELDPLIGLTISGRYRVHVLLGQGGMGKVFQAQQIPLGRWVALKVLEASRVDAEFHRRFFQEAAILAKLKSRHTVTIYDYGRDGDIYFIAMELVAGEALDRVLRAKGPLPVPRVLAIALQICRSLREAHGKGVVHRDLKPGNVMLARSEDGEELVKVLDFGLAKRLNVGAHDETDTDTVPGSPKYMPPEVIRQQPIDGRADMYSLGVMLYQMLAGVVPFDRENPLDILLAHLQQPPRPLRQATSRRDIPESLERVVMRCMAKTPGERYARMETLIEELRGIARELGLHSDPSWSAEDVGRSQRPGPGSLRLEATDLTPMAASQLARGGAARWVAAAFVTLGLGAGAAYLLQRPDPGEPAGGAAQTAAPEPLATAASAEPSPAPEAPPAAATAPSEPESDPAAGDERSGPSAAPEPSAARERARARPKPARAEAEGEPSRAEAGPSRAEAAQAPEPTAELPGVLLRVRSEPSGATVVLGRQVMGRTPVSFEWRDPEARPGGTLTLQLELEGHAPLTVTRTIEGPELQIRAQLQAASRGETPGGAEPADEPDPEPVLHVAPAHAEEQAPSPEVPELPEPALE